MIVGTDSEGQKLDVNDSVNPGMTVVELVDDTRLVIKADVPEFAAARIAVGQPATVTVESIGSGELSGSVTEVSSIVRRQSRFSQAMVRGVTIELDGDQADALRPGMSSKVSIVVDTLSAALAVPASAIVYEDGAPGVVTRSGWQPITLGGLSAGERIVTAGITSGTEIAL